MSLIPCFPNTEGPDSVVREVRVAMKISISPAIIKSMISMHTTRVFLFLHLKPYTKDEVISHKSSSTLFEDIPEEVTDRIYSQE